MANVLINEEYLTDIADAIRAKSGSVLGYKPREMATAIAAIPTGEATEVSDLAQQLIERTLSGAVAINCDTIGPSGLRSMSEMTSLSSNATAIEEYGCADNKALTTASLPYVTSLGKYAFAGDSQLTAVSIPAVQTIDNYAFNNCYSLETLDLGSVQELYGSIASNCSKLTAIIIRGTSVPDCAEQANPFPSIFKNTYTGTTPGYIYVPSAMLAAYQGYEGQPQYGRYDYWTIQSYRAIEDYPEICG